MTRGEAAIRVLRFGLVLGAIYAVVQLAPVLNRWRAGPAGRVESPKKDPYLDWADPAKGMKILMFYASPGLVTEGEGASLCYGVMNAAGVKIVPAGGDLKPSLNRCLEIFPRQDTEYTLTATDAAGAAVTQSLTVKVAADPAKAPKIAYFRVGDFMRDKYDGRPVWKLCFLAWNAGEVRIDPPVFPPWKVLQGCFYVEPKKAATYTLTVRGDRGRTAERKLTIDPARPRG
jgi:hypothetical protein